MIPNELKELKQWCIWKYTTRNGKTTKVPISAIDGNFAKSNDESTWADIHTAREGYQKYNADGLGFFFKPPYIGIDIDDISDEIERYKRGDIKDNIVSEFYEAFKSYGEISPSGNGIHIIAKGNIPNNKRRKDNVEMYDSGRFFTMTGQSLGKYKGVNKPDEKIVESLHTKYIGAQNNVINLPVNTHGVVNNLSESEIISRILDSKQADLFKAFMNDDWHDLYASQSEADLAFANLLAFWCARDFSKMDSLFRQSSLMRDKWDEKRGKTTYGQATLYKAINDTSEVYTPSGQKPKLKYKFNFAEDKTKEFPPRSYDDTGNAQRFIDRYGEIVRYNYDSKKFYLYNGQVWAEDRLGQVRQLVDATIEDMKNEKVMVESDEDQEEATKRLLKHIKSSRSNRSKTNMINEIKHHLAIVSETFDKHDMLLNTESGYLDLTSGEILPHKKERYFSKITYSDYTTTGSPDVWLDFLNDIFDGDQELIKFVQKAIGYSLTGSAKEELMFILLGSGRNGKSLFINTISDILGDYSTNMQAESLMVKKYGNNVNNDIARLRGSRFVTSSEPNEGFVFDEGLIKQMTGEDKITARYLNQEFFEFEAKFKIWLATNHRPKIRGTDDGIWRRLAVIPFDIQIPEHKVDKDLKHKLMREADSILDWALEGCLLWQKEGLKFPDKVKAAIQDYRENMDITEMFINDCCEKGKGFTIAGGKFYKAFKKWAIDNNQDDVGHVRFGERMTKKFHKGKVNGIQTYHGIRLKEKYQLNLK